MAYTTPPTFVSGATLTAAQLNILGDDLNFLKGITDGVTASGAQVNRGGNQSIPDATSTAISFTSENFDYGSWWSSGTTVTVPAGAIPAGYTSILIIATPQVYFASDVDGYRRTKVLKNGAVFAQQTVDASATGSVDQAITGWTTVVAGDLLTMEVEHTAGGALNVTASLTIIRFAPAA